MNRSPHPARDLRVLLGLARLERDRAMAGLGHAMRSRAALRAGLAALSDAGHLPGDADLPTPAMVQAALRHQHWAEGQRRMLNLRLARIEADCARERPIAARAHGRVQVLESLLAQTTATARRARERKSQP